MWMQELVANAWPSLSPVGSMTMLGSSLKDDEILPGSPVTKLTDLIPSYLPRSEQQASTLQDAFTSSHVGQRTSLGIQITCRWTESSHAPDAWLQIEKSPEAALPEEAEDLHGVYLALNTCAEVQGLLSLNCSGMPFEYSGLLFQSLTLCKAGRYQIC